MQQHQDAARSALQYICTLFNLYVNFQAAENGPLQVRAVTDLWRPLYKPTDRNFD